MLALLVSSDSYPCIYIVLHTHSDNCLHAGLCWGQGIDASENLKVTPDLKANDRVVISFPGQSLITGEATVLGAEATEVIFDSTQPLKLIIRGTLAGPLSDTQGMEQRIVNPDLKDTEIERRDVRAVAGGNADTREWHVYTETHAYIIYYYACIHNTPLHAF
jgi:hypothetical protein